MGVKSATNLLRGSVCVTVTGPFPERLINLCAQNGVVFWALDWRDAHTISLTVRRGALKTLRALCQRVGCEISEDAGRGLPFFLQRFQRRYAFLVGLALSILMVTVLSGFVLTIEVSGNEQVSSAEILTELRRLGLRPGVYGPSLERTQIAQQALLRLEGLSWLAVNLHGTRAQVLVREETRAPEMDNLPGIYDIISTADGIITHMDVLAGQALVAEGDTVTQGDVLIRGSVELPKPMLTEVPSEWIEVRARGNIQARTWHSITAVIPLTARVKEYTGERTVRPSLVFLGHRLDFFRKSSILWADYDKITAVYPCTLPGDVELPVSLTVQSYRAYTLREVEVDRRAAQALLERRLSEQLEALLGEEGEQVSADFSARVADGKLYVTLSAECIERIGRQVPGQSAAPQWMAPGPDAAS